MFEVPCRWIHLGWPTSRSRAQAWRRATQHCCRRPAGWWRRRSTARPEVGACRSIDWFGSGTRPSQPLDICYPRL